MNLKAFALAAALMISAPFMLTATPIYDYVGNPFTSVASPFTTSDKITGFVEFGSAATPGELFKSDVLAFSFSAGPLTLTSSDGLFTAFSFNFDLSGNISNWGLVVKSGPGEPFGPPDDRIRSCNAPGALVLVGIVGCGPATVSDDVNASGPVQSFNLQTPGAWTMRPVAAPEFSGTPYSMPNFGWSASIGLGLLGLAVTRRKYFRK